MSVLVVVVLALVFAVAAGMGLTWLAFDAAGYRPLRRAILRGEVDTSPSDRMRRFTLNALGTNPDIEYRYLVYDLPPGKAAILRTRTVPGATYWSAMVYDRLLQSVLPEASRGPTLVSDRDVETDSEVVVVLGRSAVPGALWLDVTGAERGVVFERHIGGAPEELGRFEVVDEAALPGLLAPEG